MASNSVTSSSQLAKSLYSRCSILTNRSVKLEQFSLPSTCVNKRLIATKSGAKKTCLYNFHFGLQAKLEPFAGYLMPIVYKDQTIKSEHLHTRSQASAFDVSHMMQVTVRGSDRHNFIESLTTTDIEGLALNKCALSTFTNERGGIIDDCIIAKRKDHLHIVSNAGNAETVWSWLNKRLPKSLDVVLERLVDRGLVALQGPKAAEVLQPMIDVKLQDLEFMCTTDAQIEGVGRCVVTRCGYTGEDGFEVSLQPEVAQTFMDSLCKEGLVKPAGLGSRDTLRLEAGLCLHGHDITDKTSPIEADLGWTVQKRRRTTGGFPGSDVILAQLKETPKIKRTGLVAIKSGPPAREGSEVTEIGATNSIGTITSGTFAPTLKKNIAMAYLPTSMAKDFGRVLNCNVRGKMFEYEITKMPFVKSNYYIRKK